MVDKNSLSSSTESVIFVVDDSEWHNILLEKILKDYGYEVHTFTDGHSLLSNLESLRPNLIISDINMPTFNGFELCQKIRILPDLRDIPVMFISTMSRKDAGDKVKANGAVGYIQKPFAKEPLLDVVAQNLLY